MPQKQTTVALDIGGVAIRLRYDLAFQRLGISGWSALPLSFLPLCREYECGRISTSGWMARFRELAEFRFTENELLAAWCAIIGETMPGMKERVEKYAAAGVKFVFLSDISETHLAETFRKCTFAHAVTDGIFSFEVGATKPDPAMFRAFESRHGRPDFYFDDRTNNIEGARKFGWNAIPFQSADQLDILGAQK